MEPTWEQNKDAGYDFREKAFAADNAYNLKYGGNACIVCMGGSFVSTININKPVDKPGDKPVSYYSKKKTYYTKYGGGDTDDYYEDEDYEDEDYEDEDYEEEDYEDDTNDY